VSTWEGGAGAARSSTEGHSRRCLRRSRTRRRRSSSRPCSSRTLSGRWGGAGRSGISGTPGGQRRTLMRRQRCGVRPAVVAWPVWQACGSTRRGDCSWAAPHVALPPRARAGPPPVLPAAAGDDDTEARVHLGRAPAVARPQARHRLPVRARGAEAGAAAPGPRQRRRLRDGWGIAAGQSAHRWEPRAPRQAREGYQINRSRTQWSPAPAKEKKRVR